MKQTLRQPDPKTYTLDKTHPKIWIAKPIPLWQGGHPEYLADELRDFLYSPSGAEVNVTVFDTVSNWAQQVLTKACTDTSSDLQKQNKSFGGLVAPDKPQYMYTQMKVGQGLFDLASLQKNTVFLSHEATQMKSDIIGVGKSKERVETPLYTGFRSAGQKQIESITSILSPGLVHLTTESKGFGEKLTVEHTAWLQDHGSPPFHAKWQNPGSPVSMCVDGKEGCEAFWAFVRATVNMLDNKTFSFGIYSKPGKGKTTLALTLWPEFWTKDEGVALYVACDPSSEALPTAWPGTVR